MHVRLERERAQGGQLPRHVRLLHARGIPRVDVQPGPGRRALHARARWWVHAARAAASAPERAATVAAEPAATRAASEPATAEPATVPATHTAAATPAAAGRSAEPAAARRAPVSRAPLRRHGLCDGSNH